MAVKTKKTKKTNKYMFILKFFYACDADKSVVVDSISDEVEAVDVVDAYSKCRAFTEAINKLYDDVSYEVADIEKI